MQTTAEKKICNLLGIAHSEYLAAKAETSPNEIEGAQAKTDDHLSNSEREVCAALHITASDYFVSLAVLGHLPQRQPPEGMSDAS